MRKRNASKEGCHWQATRGLRLDIRIKNKVTWKHELKEKVTHLSCVECLEFKVLGSNGQSGLDRATVDAFDEIKARNRKGVLSRCAEQT